MHAYMHTYIHAYMHTCIHAYTPFGDILEIQSCIYIDIYMHAYIPFGGTPLPGRTLLPGEAPCR
jgi:hypothetical protein